MAQAGENAVGSFDELPRSEPFPGVERESLTSSQLTLSRYRFAPGASFPLHSHPEEQVTVVEEGTVEMTIADSVTRLEAGGWSIVGPDVEHGITAGSAGARVLAIVSPPRRSPDAYRLADESATGEPAAGVGRDRGEEGDP